MKFWRGFRTYAVVGFGVLFAIAAVLVSKEGFGGFTITLVSLVTLAYSPLAIGQAAALFYTHGSVRRDALSAKARPALSGRRVVAVIVTNGKAPEVTDSITRTMLGYSLPGPFEVFVVAEGSDKHNYVATTLRVPSTYVAPHGSLNKMRAQHWGAFWFEVNGYGAETYFLHLDDDSLPSEEYVDWIYRMTEVSGQGHLRLREVGHHLFSSSADLTRVADCDSWCNLFNGFGKPMAVHGEGLVIRADVEEQLGWDFGTYGAEDLQMGQRLVALGYTFGRIPFPFYIAPPTSTVDFYRQRRRWTYSTLWAAPKVWAIRPVSILWILYRYAVGWLGFSGLTVLLYVLVGRLPVPPLIIALAFINLISYMGVFVYGGVQTGRKWSLLAAPMLFPRSRLRGRHVALQSRVPA